MLQRMQYPYRLPFKCIMTAAFIARPNRFVVCCRLEHGDQIEAFLPNPGRLQELLLPAVTVYLVPVAPASKRKTRYTMVGVEGEDAPVFLHTHVNNDVARYLLTHDLVPGLEGATIVRAEVPLGRSRFDFLLDHEEEAVYLEVKSCTFFGNGVAMFPDAVTARGRRHLEELAELSDGGVRTVVLFVVHSGQVDWFMPDYHTDLEFTRTLLRVRDRVSVLPVAVGWHRDFTMTGEPRLLPIPWDHVVREAADRGNYVLILTVSDGAPYPAGFYVIVGWCEENLQSHLRGVVKSGRGLSEQDKDCWAHCAKVDVYPIVISQDQRAALLEELGRLEDCSPSSQFGTPELSADGVLYFPKDPAERRSFHQVLARFRMAPTEKSVTPTSSECISL